MKKKLVSIVLSAVMAMSIVACGSSSTTTSSVSSSEAGQTTADAADTQASEAADAQTSTSDAQTYSVGIVQLMQHVALDKATEGFTAALTEKLGD